MARYDEHARVNLEYGRHPFRRLLVADCAVANTVRLPEWTRVFELLSRMQVLPTKCNTSWILELLHKWDTVPTLALHFSHNLCHHHDHVKLKQFASPLLARVTVHESCLHEKLSCSHHSFFRHRVVPRSLVQGVVWVFGRHAAPW